ncbi:hypothetical protein DFH07DRAFT_1068245 [Mycena maculata]|uniref:Uncharacterized protein n=1 Tax=Mycena maculata TaxID=230809 RepID=A0AAD7HCN4_9AGAR|nr:hypothetical protein DFH07DRAFT_1068245 [Mycena maculata]
MSLSLNATEEISVLQEIGTDVVHNFVAIMNETFLLTIYAVLVIKAGFVLLSKERRGIRAYMLTMAALFTMFIIAVVLWTLDLTNFISEAKITLLENPDEDLGIKYGNALSFVFRLAAAQDALYAYMSLMGDAIIIHRVWMLKAYYRPWVFFIPCAFLFGSLVATLMLTYCVAQIGSDIILGNFEKPAFCRNVQTVTYAMPCATTAIATILLGLTTWKYRNSIMRNSATSSSGTRKTTRSQGERILVLLVESGLLYLLFFVIQVVEDSPRVHAWIDTQTGVSFAFTLYQYCSSVIVGMYPTIIVVLAHSKRAVLDQSASVSSGSAPSRLARLNMSNQTSSTNTWPTSTFQIGTKRADEIELDAVLRSGPHTDEETGKSAFV